MHGPQVLDALCDCWEVPAPARRAWWFALRQARCPRAVEWRQKLFLFHSTRLVEPRRLLYEVCAPKEVVAVLETLVEEGRLTRRHASTIEECLLKYTDARGRWYGAPSHKSAY